MFSIFVNSCLEEMGFDPNQFYQKISQLYAFNEYLFESLIEKFYPQNNLIVQDFNGFASKNSLEDNKDLSNTLYELFNNIRQYKKGGKLGLFKEREAAWSLPSNILNPTDISDCGDLAEVVDKIEIFRGMSQEEYDSGDFGQSWSTDCTIALKFAREIYSDKAKGIVVKTTLDKGNALHYDKNKEFEMITIKGSITHSSVVVVN